MSVMTGLPRTGELPSPVGYFNQVTAEATRVYPELIARGDPYDAVTRDVLFDGDIGIRLPNGEPHPLQILDDYIEPPEGVDLETDGLTTGGLLSLAVVGLATRLFSGRAVVEIVDGSHVSYEFVTVKDGRPEMVCKAVTNAEGVPTRLSVRSALQRPEEGLAVEMTWNSTHPHPRVAVRQIGVAATSRNSFDRRPDGPIKQFRAGQGVIADLAVSVRKASPADDELARSLVKAS